MFAPELDVDLARTWYARYTNQFWDASFFMAGFREWRRDARQRMADVDSGPIILGRGSAASAFGIGAARALGRHDQAVPLLRQAVAVSWPTSFGWLVPATLSWLDAGAPPLGEAGLLLALTRQPCSPSEAPATGRGPLLPWLVAGILVIITIGVVRHELVAWRRCIRPGDRQSIG